MWIVYEAKGVTLFQPHNTRMMTIHDPVISQRSWSVGFTATEIVLQNKVVAPVQTGSHAVRYRQHHCRGSYFVVLERRFDR